MLKNGFHSYFHWLSAYLINLFLSQSTQNEHDRDKITSIMQHWSTRELNNECDSAVKIKVNDVISDKECYQITKLSIILSVKLGAEERENNVIWFAMFANISLVTKASSMTSVSDFSSNFETIDSTIGQACGNLRLEMMCFVLICLQIYP